MSTKKKSSVVEPVGASTAEPTRESAKKQKRTLALSRGEWRLMQRWAKHTAEGHEFAASVGLFMAKTKVATQNAEEISTMLHASAHSLSSIQEFINEHPIDALTVVRLISLERERGVSRIEIEAHKRMSSKGGTKRDEILGHKAKRESILQLWASGKYTTRDRCAEEECAALNMSYSVARRTLRNTPDPT